MKSLVFITTPGRQKQDFINYIEKSHPGAVRLIIVQHPLKDSYIGRLMKFYRKVGGAGMIKEIYCFCSMMISKQRREALSFPKLYTSFLDSVSYPAAVYETTNINDPETCARIEMERPDLIVVWGGAILHKRVIQLAPKVINLHTGYSPYYRGTQCNLHALLNEDHERIGVTIHEVSTKLDGGNIYSVVTTDTKNINPKVLFRTLNDRARFEYARIISNILLDIPMHTTPQDLSIGRVYRLRDWTYTLSCRIADLLIMLNKKYPSDL